MRETTPEGRLFIALGAALFGLCCAVAISAGSADAALAQLASPRRWVLVAAGLGLNYLALEVMRRFLEAKAGAVLAIYVSILVASLSWGFKWMQVQLPIGFWLGDVLVMAACYGVVAVRSRQRRAMQPDVQSSFLASRLSK